MSWNAVSEHSFPPTQQEMLGSNSFLLVGVTGQMTNESAQDTGMAKDGHGESNLIAGQ